MSPNDSLSYCSKFTRAAMCLAAVLTLATSCGRKKDKDDHGNSPIDGTALVDKPMDAETKKWWIAKANTTLRLGLPLSDVGSSEELQKLEINDIAAKLTSDPAFYDMMADFAGYWLGTKSGRIHETVSSYTYDENGKFIEKKATGINPELIERPQVINAVKTMTKGGDFFAGLFQETGPSYAKGMDTPYISTSDMSSPTPKSPNELRLAIQQKVTLEWAQFIQLLKEGKHTEFCEGWKKRIRFELGGPRSPGLFSADGYLDLQVLSYFVGQKCDQPETSKADFDKTIEEFLAKSSEKIEKVVSFLNKYEVQTGGRDPIAVPHVNDLVPLDLSELGISPTGPLYNETLFYKLQNSSTNRNRRRASWVLKRFFCDDLTPINIEAPSNHVDGPHGSDAACQSCHYKLDPMAGYFRELGFFGTSFANMPTISFDDGAQAQRDVYEQPWKASSATGREWNIGYIRSVTDDKQNTFGSNFKDLLELLKTAPEVKECFVRRVFEYAVGEEQAYDKAWGRSLLKQMNETAKTDPSLAIKQVFADVVTSKAFATREKNNNICYDFATGTKTEQRAPCRIAAILERNCTSCHNTNSRQGGLDLSTWKQLADQKPGFPHQQGGKELTSKQTFQEMADRINASDASIRMPLMKTMPAAEREELYLWLQKELAKN